MLFNFEVLLLDLIFYKVYLWFVFAEFDQNNIFSIFDILNNFYFHVVIGRIFHYRENVEKVHLRVVKQNLLYFNHHPHYQECLNQLKDSIPFIDLNVHILTYTFDSFQAKQIEWYSQLIWYNFMKKFDKQQLHTSACGDIRFQTYLKGKGKTYYDWGLVIFLRGSCSWLFPLVSIPTNF